MKKVLTKLTPSFNKMEETLKILDIKINDPAFHFFNTFGLITKDEQFNSERFLYILNSKDRKNIEQMNDDIIYHGQLIKVCSEKCSFVYVYLFTKHLVILKKKSKAFEIKRTILLDDLNINDHSDNEILSFSFTNSNNQYLKNNMNLKSKIKSVATTWITILMSVKLYTSIKNITTIQLNFNNESSIPKNDQYWEPDDEDNICFENSNFHLPLIKAATLKKIIERITYHKYFDNNLAKTILITLDIYCTPLEFLDHLINRFKISMNTPDDKSSDQNFEKHLAFVQVFQTPIRMRVLNVIRIWIEDHFYLFEENDDLLRKVLEFLNEIKCDSLKQIIEGLNQSLFKLMFPVNVDTSIPLENEGQSMPFDKNFFLHVSCNEFASQLIYYHSKLYKAIKCKELVNTAWMKDNKSVTSSNLLKFIEFSTSMSFWYELVIVNAIKINDRVTIIKKITEILMILQQSNDFCGMFEILSALKSAPIIRLTKSFKEVKSKNVNILNEVESLASGHFKKYVNKLKNIQPPCVPFIGTYLSLLCKLIEGNPDTLPNKENMFNINKRMKEVKIIQEIMHFNQYSYNINANKSFQSMFENLNPYHGKTTSQLENLIYEKSLLIEPRTQDSPTLSCDSIEPKYNIDMSRKSTLTKGLLVRILSTKSHNHNSLPYSHESKLSKLQNNKKSPIIDNILRDNSSSLINNPNHFNTSISANEIEDMFNVQLQNIKKLSLTEMQYDDLMDEIIPICAIKQIGSWKNSEDKEDTGYSGSSFNQNNNSSDSYVFSPCEFSQKSLACSNDQDNPLIREFKTSISPPDSIKTLTSDRPIESKQYESAL